MAWINLIPAGRLAAKLRRQRIRLWIVANTLCACLLAAACFAAHLAWGKDTSLLDEELAKAARQNDELHASLTTVRQRFTETNNSLETVRAITDQPDWSILLKLLASRTGDDAVISEIKLVAEPAVVAPPPGKPAPVLATPGGQLKRMRLEMRGLARSQLAASQLVLRLQESKLFDDVKLMRTAREPFMAGDAVNFSVLCTLGEQPAQP